MKLGMNRTYNLWHSSEATNSDDTESRPCLVRYKNTLYCFYISKDNRILFMVWSNGAWSSSCFLGQLPSDSNDISAAVFKESVFVTVRMADYTLRSWKFRSAGGEVHAWEAVTTPSGKYLFQVNAVAYAGKLHFFGASEDFGDVKHCSSDDGTNWSPVIPVQYGGNSISSSASPQVVTYQGFLYLVYKNGTFGYYWMKFDGEGWSHPAKLTDIEYRSSPGLVIHNGLLKAAFSDKPTTDESVDNAVYEYTFNGNCWSLPMPSTVLSTSGGVGLVTFEGMLNSVYVEAGENA